MVARVQPALAEGKEVWIGDETALREFLPWRCAWAQGGQAQVVLSSGRSGRRGMHGALRVQSGELVRLVRERRRTDESQAVVGAVGRLWPYVPKLLIWDNAPPHHPKGVLEAAKAGNIEIAWLPCRSPELQSV